MSWAAASVTAAGLSSNESFPFIRIPMFELLGNHVSKLTLSEVVAWSPLVAESERDRWSDFVQSEIGWYEESKTILLLEKDYEHDDHAPTYDTKATIRDYIWRGERNFGGLTAESPPGQTFAPVWQCSPPPYSQSFLNYDILTDNFMMAMSGTINDSPSGLFSATNGTFSTLPDTFIGLDQAAHDHEHMDYSSNVEGGTADHPHSMYVHPVYETLEDPSSKLVGYLSSVVSWDRFLSHLLPDGVYGLTAVLTNTCNQSYTYVLDGHRVSYVLELQAQDNDTRKHSLRFLLQQAVF